MAENTRQYIYVLEENTEVDNIIWVASCHACKTSEIPRSNHRSSSFTFPIFRRVPHMIKHGVVKTTSTENIIILLY